MSVVVDVGAHDGTRFSLPYSKDPNVTVYAFEPNPRLAEKLRSYQHPNLHVHNAAVGEIEEISTFHINQDDQTSSLLSAVCEGDWQVYSEQLKTIQVIEVPVQRLDNFFQSEAITDIDLLKIDAQGFELQVLKGAGDFLHSIRKIQLEVQLQLLYEGSASKAEIVEYLTNRGFELVRRTSQTNNLEENLEFVRSNRYRSFRDEIDNFEVNVPYVGTIGMPKHDYVGQLLEQGLFEAKEQAFLWLYLREGDVFFDCGTHAGLFSTVAARCLKQSGMIVGFEPNLTCLNLCANNLKQLGYDNFTALNVGLSNQDGTADLLLGKQGMSAFSSFAPGALDHSQISKEKVQVTLRSLDSLIAELEIDQVTLAKLDVEGWEGFVLDGAKQSITSRKFPIWMIEFTEANALASGSSTRELRQQVEDFGYTLCRFDATRLQLVPEKPKEQYLYDNLFAVMDLEAVNARLATANSQSIEIAMDLITRFDIAFERHSLLRQFSDLMTTYDEQNSHFQVKSEQLCTQLRDTQLQLQQLQVECAQLQQEREVQRQAEEILRQEKEVLRQEKKAMETSKFWKLRMLWIQVKHSLGLKSNT